MNPIERMELEAEQSAREDYLSEAYGREARLLAEQADDEDKWRAEEFENEALSIGMTAAELSAWMLSEMTGLAPA